MKMINRIGISLLVLQVFSFYMLKTDVICRKMECCGQTKSQPVQSCCCASAAHQPVITNINFCSCPANINDQNPRAALLGAESESKTTVQKMQAIFNHSGQYQSVDLARSTGGGLSEIFSNNQLTSADTYLFNCSFLI